MDYGKRQVKVRAKVLASALAAGAVIDSMSMDGIGAVTVVISGSNNNGNDSGNVNTTSGGKSVSDVSIATM